jgi:hypothetical protein
MVTKKQSGTKTKVTRSKAPKVDPIRSFKRYDDPTPFMTWKATHQTAYWLLIGALIVGLCVWVITLTVRVQSLYDQVQQTANADIVQQVHKKQ